MKTNFLIIAAIAFLSAMGTLIANEPAPFLEGVKADQWSETREYLVEEYNYRLPSPNDGYMHQIWLVSTSEASKRKLLFTHSRAAEVLFSPDDHWLGINHRACSTDALVLLFHQKKGVDYEEVENITGKAWDFFEKQTKSKLMFDHRYVEIVRWTDDHTILLCLHGHLDSKNHLEDWLCFYDVLSKTFSTNLDAHNKRHTVLEEPK